MPKPLLFEMKRRRKEESENHDGTQWNGRKLGRRIVFFVHLLAMALLTWHLWSTGRVNLRAIFGETLQSALQETSGVNLGVSLGAFNRSKLEHKTRLRNTATTLNMSVSSHPFARNETGVRSVFLYHACCGLGHRLARQAASYHASHRLGFQLLVDWGKCGERDVFGSMFREETEAELATYVHSLNQSFEVFNDVPCMYHALRNCVPEELEINYKFYKELAGRFLGRDKVDNFVQQHFQNKFALGIHIRDGNGEQGDFAFKRREIKVPAEVWTERAAKKIMDIIESEKTYARDLPPPVLFVAADNAKYVGLFRTQLEGQGIPVVNWDQDLPAEGTGVFMGQQAESTEKCLQKWMDMVLDMVLLSSADVVIAGQYSSFSQTMPMHLALGKNQEQRKVEKPFCELLNDGTHMDCHRNQMEWCMNTNYFNAVKSWLAWDKDNASVWPEFLAQLPTNPLYRNFEHHIG